MFGTLGGPELFLIFVVALIVFGPRKLPEIGKSLGKMMAEFRRASNEFRSTIESEVEAEKIREAMRIEPPKVEPVSPLAAQAAAPAAPVAPGSTAATTEGQTPSTEQPVDPAAQPSAAPAAPESATQEGVPQTVSRQPENSPIEPK